jgi:diguanylate cyclase (GGDEF)-like protein
LLQRLDRAVADAASFALVLMDVDNFKLFNDTYGHLTGDAVLASVAATIRENCRDGDTAGRYGGDELALLLPSATRAEAEAVVTRLMSSIHSRPHLAWDGSLIPISVSPGIACFPEDGRTRRDLVAAADAAMYEAKRCSSGVSAHGFGASRGPRLPGIAMHDLGQMLGTASLEVLEGLVAAVDAKDRYTREHGDHVARLGLLLAETLDLPLDQRRAVTVAGLLHDVGKIGIPDRILRKPGTLTKDEYDQIKRHVPFGVAIVQGVISDRPTVEAIAFHHERWDGRGYPRGLAGEVTPLLGRIMQVADATSSMLLDRPYRKGMPWARVAAELRAGAGSQFDPDLVEVFIGSFERLSPASQAQREL